MNLSAAFFTLGCKLNFSETATLASMLAQKGIKKTRPDAKPDICVVNTCSVTDTADKKARHLIRSLSKKYPSASIFVTGCYAQLKPDEVSKLPGVEMVLGSNEKLHISQYIDSWLMNRGSVVETTPGLKINVFMPSCERGDRTRYFLKVQDGCDYFCTYCTIPYARGRSRSGNISELVEMAQQVALKGGKEIVITGVNIGTFGIDNNQDFLSLLKKLDRVAGISRYRISSIEPNLLTDEIIEWIAFESRAFMPHFHIPLQSGSDKVLKLMNRRYDTELFKTKISRIRELIPDSFIGVDIIAGARGETEEEWTKSYSFASGLDIAKFHVFPYSERPGTKALTLGEDVPVEKRRIRVNALTELSDKKTAAFINGNLGNIRPVLWEKPTNRDMMHGLTDNYIRVEAPYKPELINNVSEVMLLSLKPGTSDIGLASHIETE
ncbi:MAG: tRNA (N(6)-L-threonylcarbamoyladenosine(37)-C(2))-methylthiotransferase MtaB [Muribaculaceae bacterium]|nr:tRNA (N(6)-L-threonylcarbamoyladenosine(37)-C(2))-methylthiotransferase MtaB [Muribaculaceae bacterium]